MTAPAQLIEGRRVAAMIEKAVAAEREAIEEALWGVHETWGDAPSRSAVRECIKVIRARGAARPEETR